MKTIGQWNRRAMLRSAAGLAGGALITPRLTTAMTGQTPASGGDADALFTAGQFAAAADAYDELIANDPLNLPATRQRGYIALLSNRFPEAEHYLGQAIELAPADEETNQLLADCYTRQDKYALAIPHWRAIGDDANAEVLAAVPGTPYEIHGETGRAPWLQLDPSPLVEVSLNDGPPERFAFYTRVESAGMSAAVAARAGIRAVTEVSLDYLDPPLTMYFGVLDSLKLGGIEVRNLPVSWSDDTEPSRTGGVGMLGTTLLAHFLSTVDYAGRSLILRRRTQELAEQIRVSEIQAGAEPLPLWQAHQHIIFSQGSIAGSGPQVMGLNIGGIGENNGGMSLDTARRLALRIDEERPVEISTGLQPNLAFPCYPSELRLGAAVANESYCMAIEQSDPAPHGFNVLGQFTHSFFKPYHVTLDFVDMACYIAPGQAS